MGAQRGGTDTAGEASIDVASSLWTPFRHPVFTVVWTATVVSNIGSWMYNAASAWLMTTLSPDPLVVALVQVATGLPVFLFCVAGGRTRRHRR